MISILLDFTIFCIIIGISVKLYKQFQQIYFFKMKRKHKNKRSKNKKRKKRKKSKPKLFDPQRRFATNLEGKIVAESQDWKCNHCRNKLTAYYQVDHILPVSEGGTTIRSNLQVLCASCHAKKSTLERSGVCPHCMEEVKHSRFFPCHKLLNETSVIGFFTN